jgi:hypothetical protein
LSSALQSTNQSPPAAAFAIFDLGQASSTWSPEIASEDPERPYVDLGKQTTVLDRSEVGVVHEAAAQRDPVSRAVARDNPARSVVIT